MERTQALYIVPSIGRVLASYYTFEYEIKGTMSDCVALRLYGYSGDTGRCIWSCGPAERRVEKGVRAGAV